MEDEELDPKLRSELDRFTQEVKLGVYDGALTDLLGAIQFRIAGGATAFRWRIRWDDLEVTEDNITLGELEDIEKELRVSWASVHPVKSAQQCSTLLRAAMKHRTELTDDEVTEAVGKLTASDALDAIDQYEVRRPPLEAETPTTT